MSTSTTILISQKDIIEQLKTSYKLSEIIAEVKERKFIEKFTAEIGYEPEQSELQAAADQLRIANGLISSEDTWKWLEQQNLSLDDFEGMAKYKCIYKKVAKQFVEKVESYFYENQLDYTAACIYEIVFADEDEALEAFFNLQEGETTFFSLAQEYIKDKESRRRGGYLGKVKKLDMKPDISAKVFAANPPQLLKPIVTSKGVHLIKVEEIVYPELTEALKYQIISDLTLKWLKMQMESLEFQINIV